MTCRVEPTLDDACLECGHHRLVHYGNCLICDLITLTNALLEREKELQAGAAVLHHIVDVQHKSGTTYIHARIPTHCIDGIVGGCE